MNDLLSVTQLLVNGDLIWMFIHFTDYKRSFIFKKMFIVTVNMGFNPYSARIDLDNKICHL